MFGEFPFQAKQLHFCFKALIRYVIPNVSVHSDRRDTVLDDLDRPFDCLICASEHVSLLVDEKLVGAERAALTYNKCPVFLYGNKNKTPLRCTTEFCFEIVGAILLVFFFSCERTLASLLSLYTGCPQFFCG